MRTCESNEQIGRYGLSDFIIDRIVDLRHRIFGDPEVPTLLHITHPKAGSTWMFQLLSRLFGSRCASRDNDMVRGGKLTDHVFEQRRVYSGMFSTRDEITAHPELAGVTRFIVIRDLRDTLVSLYFSQKISHTPNSMVEKTRPMLQKLPEEEGLLYLVQNRMQKMAEIQRSWIGRGDLVLRYEDLVIKPCATLESALIDQLRLPVSRDALRRAVRRTHFQTVFKRKLGVEDVKSHGRKGLPGDWHHHFTPEIRRQFSKKFGDILIVTGYERDDQWVRAAGDSTRGSSESLGGIMQLLAISISIFLSIVCGLDQDQGDDQDSNEDKYTAVQVVRVS
jgi:Sulfotransferase domain